MILYSFQNINQTFKKIHPSSGGIDDKWFFNTFLNINQTLKKIFISLGRVNYKWLFYIFKNIFKKIYSSSSKMIIIEIL